MSIHMMPGGCVVFTVALSDEREADGCALSVAAAMQSPWMSAYMEGACLPLPTRYNGALCSLSPGLWDLPGVAVKREGSEFEFRRLAL